MYSDILFPVSFYLMDAEDLHNHASAVANKLDADIHLLSFIVSDEEKREIETHKNQFDELAIHLEETGVAITKDLREDIIPYDEVAERIVDEARDGFDLILMGHGKVRRDDDDFTYTTAEEVINASPIPTLVIPMGSPRFRDV